MMLSKYQERVDKLRSNNPSFNTLYQEYEAAEYEAAESEKQKRELENKINEILIKVK